MAADNVYTLARPYAEAVFELADGAEARESWSDALAALSAIVENDDVAAVMGSPAISDEALAEAVIGIGGQDFDARQANFVRLLIDNERLVVAPAIAELYEARRAEAEQRLEVEVASAKKLTKKQQEALTKALAKRFERDVSVSYVDDDSIIGGLVIRAGDTVIDGSLTAQLARMRQRLAH
ncbi:F0F1 ATP synthase subunit delta [Salinisphaera sp. Q1T1-3]|uniref:F0F1 ATP synthase subunit delta n=1 Tax=Salinisphaera sp. Q1T1-3 TaxID=2321229 RepID=UPI000E71D0ED|nr:F0F1 ATP synthase subunit delta [Salinisphaera sp. Q1T1-3]RJS93331.1 F0F1 ATP synthase subunit delta [Salinisphaera sp. Q1T1-3]